MKRPASTERSRIVSRPMVYILAGLGLAILALVLFLDCLLFPRVPAPQYPNAVTQQQALFVAPILLLPSLFMLWWGYRACIIADEGGVRRKRGRQQDMLSWGEIAVWVIQYDYSGNTGPYCIEGREGQSISWGAGWSNFTPLGELIARKLGAADAVWPTRFTYSGQIWVEKVVIPPLMGGLFGVAPAVFLVYMLWASWGTLPHHGIAVVLAICVVVAASWLATCVLRWGTSVRQAEARHRHERILVAGDELTWSDGTQTWNAQLVQVRLRRERKGDWVFEMPQGEFIVESGTPWRSSLQRTLERQQTAFHLDFEGSSSASATRFGFDTPSNRVVSGFPAAFLSILWMGISAANLVFPRDEHTITLFAIGKSFLLLAPFALLSALGWYACRKMAYEIGDTGLWRQGLWTRELMPWEDLTEVGSDAQGAFVKGRVRGRVIRWAINPFFMNERPAALQRAIKERAPHVKASNLL